MAYEELVARNVKSANFTEAALVTYFTTKIKLIPNNPPKQFLMLKKTKKVGENDAIIFGTGDN